MPMVVCNLVKLKKTFSSFSSFLWNENQTIFGLENMKKTEYGIFVNRLCVGRGAFIQRRHLLGGFAVFGRDAVPSIMEIQDVT